MLRAPVRLQNPIQHYAWGSRTALAALLGRVPSGEPEAELWMGAHPQAPSRVDGSTLGEHIARDPEGTLGAPVLARFGPELPFLFKILAVAAPLSLQAHPDPSQAREGFAREESRGIPRDAPERSYRDASAKPELVCALSRFEGLKGFRAPRSIAARLEAFCPETLGARAAALAARPDEAGWQALFADLLRLDPALRERAVAEASARAAREPAEASLRWLVRLAEAHPGDVGALAPLFLHHVVLEPGEAVFLPAGELHCYLEGTALELMASSDNVLRGGLTRKHVDRDELLRVLRFAASEPEVLHAVRVGDEQVWHAPTRAFRLSRLDPDGPRGLRPTGPEILLALEDVVEVDAPASGTHVALAAGESLFVPAAAGALQLAGPGTVFRATLPPPGEPPAV